MALHHFKKNELTFETLEGTIGPGKASISRIIGTDHSTTMGGGILRLTNCSFPWTVRYDEVVYVLSGEIQIISDRKTLTGREGDTFFLTKDTPLTYHSDTAAAVFYSLFPVNWSDSNMNSIVNAALEQS